jgi:iron(III)-enterobactin esterase
VNSDYFSLITHQGAIFSECLQRHVDLSVVRPRIFKPGTRYQLLLCNDGQDFGALKMEQCISDLVQAGELPQLVAVGIHANGDRINEYGTALRPDYAGRGAMAGATTDFVLNELTPFLGKTYPVELNGIVYAGFSLGGLMALDIVWNHPHRFSKIAVFSGALWWRAKPISEGYHDTDRIMHGQINRSKSFPPLRFWFQAGSEDETDDRDGDGVIDAIQDTLECISELERKGYGWNKDIFYREIEGGRHDTNTWSRALPEFLRWAFPVIN